MFLNQHLISQTKYMGITWNSLGCVHTQTLIVVSFVSTTYPTTWKAPNRLVKLTILSQDHWIPVLKDIHV